MKDYLRKKFLAIRSSMSLKDRIRKSNQIKKKLFSLPEYKKAKKMMFFVSYKSEIDTHEMISRALKEKIVAVPKTSSRSMVPSVITSMKELSPNKKGILEPRKIRKIGLKEIDVVIVPGIAFDKKCHRLGYGRGYYDRFLKKVPNALKISLAFNCQITKKLPYEKHDIPVNIVITENNILKF